MPLPNAEAEVKAIHELLGSTGTLLLGQSATRTAVQSMLTATPRQFVHFATHGLMQLEQPELSALACASIANRDYRDFLLFTDEVARFDLRTDVVVLASCESGLGQHFTGAAPFSMSLSFLEAGARNVIHTTRKVNDEFGLALFTSMYRHYLTAPAAGYARALQRAKCDLLKDATLSNPRYWSPVLLIGR